MSTGQAVAVETGLPNGPADIRWLSERDGGISF